MLGANLGLLFTMFAWATQIPALGVLAQNWDPYFLGMVRYAGALPILYAILKLREPGPVLPVGLPRWRLWLLGTAGIGLFAPIYTLAIAHSNLVVAAIVASTAPAVAAVVARLFFAQPLDRRMIPAIALAVVGCAIATWDPNNAEDPFDLEGGEPLFLVASALWSWYSLAAQRWMLGHSQLRITVATLVPGTLVAFAVFLVAGLLGQADLQPNGLRNGLDLALQIWVSLGAVVLGMVFWNYGVQKLGVVVASLFLNVIPVLTILVLAIMGTPPAWTQVLGGVLVIAGLLQAQLRGFARGARPAKPARLG